MLDVRLAATPDWRNSNDSSTTSNRADVTASNTVGPTAEWLQWMYDG